jgi:hypothetical protein
MGGSDEHVVPGTPAADNRLSLVYNEGMVQEVMDQRSNRSSVQGTARRNACISLALARLRRAWRTFTTWTSWLVSSPWILGSTPTGTFTSPKGLRSFSKAKVDLVELGAIDNPYFKEAMDKTKVPVYESA